MIPTPRLRFTAPIVLERQCALIHLEQAWADNGLTVEGSHETSAIAPLWKPAVRRPHPDEVAWKKCTAHPFSRALNSVFECLVDPTQLGEFKIKIAAEYNDQEDSLRFYFLGANWQG